jgi:hypothetical protein
MVCTVIFGTPAAAATIHANCAATAEVYSSIHDEDLYSRQEVNDEDLQQLHDITTVTIDLLGFFGAVEQCPGPFGKALVCATADKLLIEIDHQHNQSMEQWQSEIARPPIVLQLVELFLPLRARYTRVCIVPGRKGQPA